MYEKTCALCGKQFESPYPRSKYCKDCQATAYRNQNTKRARGRRADMRDAEKEFIRLQEDQERQARKKELSKLIAKRKRKLKRKANKGDALAIMALERTKPGYLYSPEYWKAFKAYRLDFDKNRFETYVNGISTREDDFAELVVESMATCTRHGIHIEERKV